MKRALPYLIAFALFALVWVLFAPSLFIPCRP